MFKRSIATLILSCITMVAIAAQSPVDLLQNVSNQMIDKLKQDQSTIKNNPQHVESLARQIILPHVEITTMSRLALGRDGWLKATPAQKQQFVNQFTTLMIRTYSKALASYSDQTVKFFPIRGSLNGQTQTQVDSKILQPGGPAIPMSYRMVLRGNDWKVYDMSVDGVSMVQSFHSQFAQELNQGGVAGLLNAMVKQNASKEKA